MLKYIAIIVTFFLIGYWFWQSPQVTLSDSSNMNSSTISDRAVDDSLSVTPQKQNILPEFLQNSSLKGTTIDGLYPVDKDGNLLFSEDIKHRFEYFLSTMGEFSLAQVQQMIREDITLNLEEPARSQALQLFKDYVGYKYALADLEKSLQAPQEYELNDIERMRYQLQQLRDKRREYFNQETVDAFFGFDEMYDDFMLSRLEIQANSQLTAAQKAEQIESLEQSLPEEVKAMREETQKVSEVFKVTEEMREQGASDSEIFELNSQEFGQEAAMRLQALDEKRQEWQNQVDMYIEEKQQLQSNDSLSDAEKTERLNNLLSSFNENERRRLKAYELMRQEQGDTN